MYVFMVDGCVHLLEATRVNRSPPHKKGALFPDILLIASATLLLSSAGLSREPSEDWITTGFSEESSGIDVTAFLSKP